MSATLPTILTTCLTAIAFIITAATGGHVVAQQAAAPPARAGASYYDITGSVRALQELLAVLGHYDQQPSGKWDEATANAVLEFQLAHQLPPTAQLDLETIDALGGPVEKLNNRPRFLYVIREGDDLSTIAARFNSTVPWIARFNPQITSVEGVAPGTQIAVPIRFPLPDDFRAERVDVLADRFFGAYVSDVAFQEVGALVTRMSDLFRKHGFEVDPRGTPVDGITLRGQGIVLGRIIFSASQATGKTLVHLALLFRQQDCTEESPPLAEMPALCP